MINSTTSKFYIFGFISAYFALDTSPILYSLDFSNPDYSFSVENQRLVSVLEASLACVLLIIGMTIRLMRYRERCDICRNIISFSVTTSMLIYFLPFNTANLHLSVMLTVAAASVTTSPYRTMDISSVDTVFRVFCVGWCSQLVYLGVISNDHISSLVVVTHGNLDVLALSYYILTFTPILAVLLLSILYVDTCTIRGICGRLVPLAISICLIISLDSSAASALLVGCNLCLLTNIYVMYTKGLYALNNISRSSGIVRLLNHTGISESHANWIMGFRDFNIFGKYTGE